MEEFNNFGILVVIFIYEIALVFGVGYWLKKRETGKKVQSGSFTVAGKSLPWYVVGVTLGLTVLGTPHIFGILEMTWHMGAVSIWFSLAHVLLLVVACTTTAIWAMKMNVTTMPEMLNKIFGKRVRLLVSCVMAGMIWGIMTLEAQGLGIVFATLSDITIQQGAIIGGLLGLAYVLLAGMKEIGWVNLINCAVMYLGIVIAFVYITLGLPAGGWDGISLAYAEKGEAFMTSVMGTPELLVSFAAATVIATVTCHAVGQQLIQPAISAKNEKHLRKALWLAAPVNGLFGVFIVCIGLAAKMDPDAAALGPKLAGASMFMSLPPWLVAWVFAAFLGAVLSSFAATALAPATIFTIDVYKNLFDKDLSPEKEVFITRMGIVVLGALAIIAAGYMPPIISAINWLFAWLTPVFVLVVLGLFWRRSSFVSMVTLACAWIANGFWTFSSLPEMLGQVGMPNVYITLAVSVVVAITMLLFSKSEPGLFVKNQGKLSLEGSH